MPIPVIAMLVVGVVSVLWPGPKLDHKVSESGAIFSPQFKGQELSQWQDQVRKPIQVATTCGEGLPDGISSKCPGDGR